MVSRSNKRTAHSLWVGTNSACPCHSKLYVSKPKKAYLVCIVAHCGKVIYAIPPYPIYLLASTWSQYVAHQTTQECVIIVTEMVTEIVIESELGIRNKSHYSPTEVTACLKGETDPLSELSTKCSLFSWPTS